jgi:hypothetical protein
MSHYVAGIKTTDNTKKYLTLYATNRHLVVVDAQYLLDHLNEIKDWAEKLNENK